MSRMALNIRFAVGLVHEWRSLCYPTMANACLPDVVPRDELRWATSALTRMVGVWPP